MAIAEVLLSALYDKDDPVNGVGTTVNDVMIRDRWNQTATVRVVDHPADSDETPAYFTNNARFKTWKLGNQKPGTAHILADMSGIDIVIPGADSTINPETPPTPTSFSTGLVTATTIDLSWDPMWQIGAIQGYQLDRLVVGEDVDYVRIATLNRNAITFIAQNLPPDSLIRFRLRCYDALVGPYAFTDGITDVEGEETIPPVDSGEIINITPESQGLVWTYNTNVSNYNQPPDTFRIERLISGTDSSYQPLATVDGDTFQYLVEELPSSTLIFYRIRAEREADISTWASDSETTDAETPLEPPAWSTVPPFEGEARDLPIMIDMNTYVTSATPLVDWVYFPRIDELTIGQDGTLIFTEDFQESTNLIAVTCTNDDGTSTSNQFQIRINDEVENPDSIRFTDDFNRPNELLDETSVENYGPSSAPLELVNNEARHQGDTYNSISYQDIAIIGSRYFIEFTVKALPSSSNDFLAGITLFTATDWPDVSNFYAFCVLNNRVQIRRYYQHETFVLLAERLFETAPGQRLRGSSRNGIHELFINGDLLLAVEDRVWAPLLGLAGMYGQDYPQDARLDDFVLGVPAGEPSVPSINPVTELRISGISTNWARIEWSHLGAVHKFNIQRFIVGTNLFWQTLDDDLDPQARRYDDDGLPSETQIMYRIRAERDNGETSAWEEVSDETDSDDELNDAYDFETTNHSFTTLDLEWKYDGTGNTGFTLHQLEDGEYVSIGGETDPSIRIRNVTDLTAGTTYEFRMRAYDASGGSAWQYTSGTTDVPVSDDPPEWITVPNFVIDAGSLPWSADMNDYVTSDSPITAWSIPNFSGIDIDSEGILTATTEGDWSLRVTATNSNGSSQSNFFSLAVGDLGDVHYAPTRFPLRINNPRPANDRPNNQVGMGMQPWSRYTNTHTQVPYEVPIGVGGGRPPFRFAISGSSNFTLTTKSPDFNPGMTTWAEVTAAGGAEGTYTVTVTDMDNESQSVSVTVVNDDSMFVFIAPDGDDGASGTIGDPIETCQGWYGATAYTVSRFQGMIVVYRAGSYVMPNPIGYDYREGAILYSDELNPVVHIAMPGEAVSVTGRANFGSGFFTNDGAGQPSRDNYWAGIKIDGDGNLGSAFSMWSGSHRHVWWKMQFEDIQASKFTAYRDNFGGMIYLSKGVWRSSSISAIDIEFIDWSNGSINHGGYQSYGNIHANLDWLKVIDCTSQSPGEVVFFKSDSNYCTVTSFDSWWTSEYVNNINRSMMNLNNYNDSSTEVSEDYGVPWEQASSQVRYCRIYQDPDNHKNQNLRLCDSGTNRVMNKSWMDRCTHIGWAESTSGAGGVGTNPVTGAPIPPELVRCIHLANRPYGSSDLPLGYIVTDTVNENFSKLEDYIEHDTGIVKDAAIRFQIGYEVPATIATKFFGDIDNANQLSEED